MDTAREGFLTCNANEPTVQLRADTNLSLTRGINFKFPLQPHQRRNITVQYEELSFSKY